VADDPPFRWTCHPLTLVPDSGTGDLVGISGTMTIDIKDGRHVYTFDYSLP
jgi:hypothetical protein